GGGGGAGKGMRDLDRRAGRGLRPSGGRGCEADGERDEQEFHDRSFACVGRGETIDRGAPRRLSLRQWFPSGIERERGARRLRKTVTAPAIIGGACFDCSKRSSAMAPPIRSARSPASAAKADPRETGAGEPP